jgi:hypothetical protein
MDSIQRKIRQVQRMAETAQPLQPAENHPGPGRGYTKKPHEKAKSGNRSDYLVARIARDRPDILERMKAGEFAACVRQPERQALLKTCRWSSRYYGSGSERHRKSGRLYAATSRGRMAHKVVQNATGDQYWVHLHKSI